MDDKWVFAIVIGIFVVFFVGVGGAVLAQEEGWDVQPEDEIVGGATAEELVIGAMYGALALAILACLYIGGAALLMAGRIAASRPIPAGDASDADGEIEVQGTVEPIGDTFAAQFSGRAAVAATARELRKRRATGTATARSRYRTRRSSGRYYGRGSEGWPTSRSLRG